MSNNGPSGAGGGVRNLRAMFENKQDEGSVISPPPHTRGRSPATPVKSNNNTNGGRHTPTALNKVRTNFVHVEKNNTTTSASPPLPTDTILALPVKTSPDTTQVLAKPASEDDMSHRRRDSFSLHDELPLDHKGIVARKKSIAEEFAARAHSLQVGETIPEFAVETPALETPAVDGNRLKHQLGYGYSAPPGVLNTANPDDNTKAQEPGTKLAESDPKSEKAVSDGKALEGASLDGLTGSDAAQLKKSAGQKVLPSRTPVHPSSRPIVTSRTPTGVSVNSTAIKSPAVTPSASRSGSTRNVAGTVASKPLNTNTNGPPKPATASSRAASSTTAAKKPAASTTAPSSSGTGFVKPKPRSPTRPARLPASLMAPTASSLQKTGADPLGSSSRRGSGGSVASSKPTGDRAPSRSMAPPKAVNTRPSLGPPPKKKDEQELRRQTSRSSMSGSTRGADDSFLARMMRPTTASKGKVHDKGAPAVSTPQPRVVHPHKAEQHAQNAVKDDATKPVVTEAELRQEPKSEPESTKVDAAKPPSPKKDSPKKDTPKVEEPKSEPATKSESKPATTTQSSESPQPERRKLSSGFLPIPKITRKKKPEEAVKEEPILVPANSAKEHQGHHKQRSSVSVMSESIPEVDEEQDLEDKPKSTPAKTPRQSMSPRKTEAKRVETEKKVQAQAAKNSEDKQKADAKNMAEEAVQKTQEKLDDKKADAAIAAVEGELKKSSSSASKSPSKSASAQKNSQDLTASQTEEVAQQLETFRLTEDAAQKTKEEADASASVDVPASSNTASEKTNDDIKHENEVIDAAFRDAKAEYEKASEMRKVDKEAKESKLTSDMLTGSALASDEDLTPVTEKGNIFDSQGKTGNRVSSAVSPKTGPLKAVLNTEQAKGEVDSEMKGQKDGVDDDVDANPLEQEIAEKDEEAKSKKAEEGKLFVEGEVDEMKVDDKVEDAEITALAS